MGTPANVQNNYIKLPILLGLPQPDFCTREMMRNITGQLKVA